MFLKRYCKASSNKNKTLHKKAELMMSPNAQPSICKWGDIMREPLLKSRPCMKTAMFKGHAQCNVLTHTGGINMV